MDLYFSFVILFLINVINLDYAILLCLNFMHLIIIINLIMRQHQYHRDL